MKIADNTAEQMVWYEELTKLADLWTTPVKEVTLSNELEELEKRRIEDAMVYAEGNKSHAAKYLGMGRTLLIHKLKKYQIV
jgi:DNA-binding NtrC family response regulator